MTQKRAVLVVCDGLREDSRTVAVDLRKFSGDLHDVLWDGLVDGPHG